MSDKSDSGDRPPSYFSWIYFIMLALVVAAQALGFTQIILILKPLLILLLMVLIFRSSLINIHRNFKNLVIAALTFSFLGMLVLSLETSGNYFFLYALLLFLVGHLFYLSAFVYDILKNKSYHFHWGQLAVATLVVVYGAEFYILNRYSFDQLWLPVMLYTIVITALGVVTVMRHAVHPHQPYFFVASGAMLLICADSLFAIQRFVVTADWIAPLMVIAFYTGHYLMVKGVVYRDGSS